MANKKKMKKKKKQSLLARRVKLGIKVGVLVLLNFVLIVGIYIALRYGGTILKYQDDAKTLVRNSTSETFRQAETSVVYDTNNKQMSVLKGEKDVYYLAYEDIPLYVKEAMIAIEDKKFFSHNGIDLKANFRAFLSLLKHKGKIKQGASTITQQLSRNIFLNNQKSYERKLKEVFIALELEKKYSKSQLLEFYLNNIYFANGYYGIQAASKGYFGKSIEKLSLSQMAFLCAIPNNPTLYDPVDNKENTIKRRDRILGQMYKDKQISLEDYNDAIAEKIKLKRKKINRNNYVDTFVYNSAIKALMKQSGFEFQNKYDSEEERKDYLARYKELYNQYQQMLSTEGYRIYTSIDLKKQRVLQDSIDENLKAFTEKSKEGIYKLQSAATCIDNKTGLVVAIVGGRYQKTAGYTLNRAYQSYRQPGSSIKPLIVYTPSFERGLTLNTIVNDKKIKDGPSNSNNTYLGKITIKTAVEKSVNTIAWQLFDKLTPTIGLDYLYQMNFARISSNDYGLASSLGGLTNGANTVEMASAYATIENDGVYREPTCIVKILDSKGEEIVSNSLEEKKIYDKNATRMMTNALEGVIREGTGRGFGIPNMATAGKTGTTNDKKDGWFVGYTPYYTTSVWVGYDIPKTLDNLFGGTYPGQIWFQFMKQIHEGLDSMSFPIYIGNTNQEDKKEKEIEPTQNPDEIIPTETPASDESDQDYDEDNYGDEGEYGDVDEDSQPIETPTNTEAPTNDSGTDVDEQTPSPDHNSQDSPTTDNSSSTTAPDNGGDDSGQTIDDNSDIAP